MLNRDRCKRVVFWGLVLLPWLAAGATNSTERLEVRCGTQVLRVAVGQGEAAASGSYDVRVYDVTNGAELAFVDGLVLLRDGVVKRAWFCDLNGDGQPEVAVWTVSTSADTHGQLDILVTVDGLLQKIEMPELTSAWKRGYQGRDTYRVEKGSLYRTFPIYKSADAQSHPTGGERTLKLIYENERWMWRLHAVK